MKKVLALVLAVVMVCTMALAVDVQWTGDPAATPGTTEVAQVKPGEVLYFTVADLAGATGPYLNPKTNEFVPANNNVTVTYGKGAELVKSAGWVRTVLAQKDADGKYVDDAAKWQYQIVLKDSESAVCNKDTVEFSIIKVAFKATGETTKEYSVEKETLGKFERDYGWTTTEFVLATGDNAKQTIAGLNAKFDQVGVLYNVVSSVDIDGKVVTENVYTTPAVAGAGQAANNSVAYKVLAGQKVLVKNIAMPDTTTDGKLYKNNGFEVASVVANAVNETNLTGTATITNWANAYNAYAYGLDGKVTKLAVTVDDGVGTVTVPAYSIAIIYNGTLRNVSAAAGTTTGTTTNPGTGANDVVGVAAALAVVALVSGAAISLKK